jgi:hypothetical protein
MSATALGDRPLLINALQALTCCVQCCVTRGTLTEGPMGLLFASAGGLDRPKSRGWKAYWKGVASLRCASLRCPDMV